MAEQAYINGEWVQALQGKTFQVRYHECTVHESAHHTIRSLFFEIFFLFIFLPSNTKLWLGEENNFRGTRGFLYILLCAAVVGTSINPFVCTSVLQIYNRKLSYSSLHLLLNGRVKADWIKSTGVRKILPDWKAMKIFLTLSDNKINAPQLGYFSIIHKNFYSGRRTAHIYGIWCKLESSSLKNLIMKPNYW